MLSENPDFVAACVKNDIAFIGPRAETMRALALGADFVMLGKAWHYALGALGPLGPAHLTDILRKDLIANMGQLGLENLKDCAVKIIAKQPG